MAAKYLKVAEKQEIFKSQAQHYIHIYVYVYVSCIASFKVSSTGDTGLITPLNRWSNWGTERWHSLPASLFLPESGMKTNLPSKDQQGCVSPPDKYLQDAGSVSNQQPNLSCLTTQSMSHVTWLFSSRNASNLPLNLQYGFFFSLQESSKVFQGKSHTYPQPSSFILPPNTVSSTEVKREVQPSAEEAMTASIQFRPIPFLSGSGQVIWPSPPFETELSLLPLQPHILWPSLPLFHFFFFLLLSLLPALSGIFSNPNHQALVEFLSTSVTLTLLL